MARKNDRAKAIELRLAGKSYNQIKNELVVSKSTLSLWLRNYPLAEEHIKALEDQKHVRIERYRETRRKKRIAKLQQVYRLASRELLPLTRKEFLIAGYLLYAGEGAKTRSGTVSLSNNNPAIINFFIHWLEKTCDISREKIFVRLQLYKDMDAEAEMEYWKKELGLNVKQFKKPYFKNTRSADITYKGEFGHGTCNVFIFSTPLFEKIVMSIKVLTDNVSACSSMVEQSAYIRPVGGPIPSARTSETNQGG